MMEKQAKALSDAISALRHSELWEDVLEVYLYGSCARGEERFDSDIDLCVCVKRDTSVNLAMIRSECNTAVLGYAEVDMHFIKGLLCEQDNSCYIEEVRKDGVLLWSRS